MSTVAVATAYVTVRCHGCGRERELTARQARRAGKCPMCLKLENLPEPQPEHFRFWLELFSDWEIVVLVTKIAPAAQVNAKSIAVLRADLAEREEPRPVRVLSSVSERAGELAA